MTEDAPDRSLDEAASAQEDAAPDSPAQMSPMMAQYWTIKRANPGVLLFFRMGDFYELFFDDARQAAGALDIALTVLIGSAMNYLFT